MDDQEAQGGGSLAAAGNAAAATRVSSSNVLESRSVDFQELHDACLMSSMCYKSPAALKEAYGAALAAVGGNEESSSGGSIRYFMLSNERAKHQKLVVCGILSESQFNAVTSPSSSAAADVYRSFQLDKAAEQIDKTVMKLLRKDFQIQIFGHAMGASLAVLLALHLHNEGFKLNKIITFGQPRIVKPKEASMYKNLPLLRVFDFYDAVAVGAFPGYQHIGPSVVLLPDLHYSYVAKQPEEEQAHSGVQSPKKKFECNHVEVYLRNLKAKIKAPLFIAWEERSKVLR